MGQGAGKQKEGSCCHGSPKHMVPGSCKGLNNVPGVSPCWALGQGSPSYLISDLASKGHPCSWKETHRLELDNLPDLPYGFSILRQHILALGAAILLCSEHVLCVRTPGLQGKFPN
jgi:hypothetical protein